MFYLIGYSTYRVLDYSSIYEGRDSKVAAAWLVWSTGIKLINTIRFDHSHFSLN